MYRNNKVNLWLRTICVAVALLGMLFFTHSQFSIAATPMSITVTVTSSNSMSTVGIGNTVDFQIVITPASMETVDATSVLLYYSIGSGASASSFSVTPTLDMGKNTDFSHTHTLANGETGLFNIDAVRFETGAESIANYTSDTSPGLTNTFVPAGGITANTPDAITNPTSIDIIVSATSTPGTNMDESTVINTETINIEVIVVESTDAVLVTSTGNEPDFTYKIGTGASVVLTLTSGDNTTHWTGSILVGTGTGTGLFNIESVTLTLNNEDGDAVAEEKTYDANSFPVPNGRVIPPGVVFIVSEAFAVADPTSIAVGITADGDGDGRVTNGENLTIEMLVVESTNGKINPSAGSEPSVQFKIGEDAKNVTFTKGDNDTHWLAFVNVTDSYSSEGAFELTSVTLNLQNTDRNAAGNKMTVFEENSNLLTVTGGDLTIETIFRAIDPASIDVNITADSDEDLGIGDNITFSAKIVNSTADDGNVLNVTVHYKINMTNRSTVLTNQGGGLWNGTLTIMNATGSGNLTFVSVEIGLQNRDATDNITKHFDAATAMIEGALNITIDLTPAADNTTTSASATTSAASNTTSSETSTDSPVSIFAVFILLASISMAVGVYTLRRRQ